jgi:putative SOS response-associated peptidase YedK
MCGRFTQFKNLDTIAKRYGIEEPEQKLHPRYNAAPTQMLPVIIVERGERKLEMMRWGLIPPWAESITIGSSMINARAETLAEKPSFRNALKSRRCLVPADGFYEWMPTGRGKQPMHISLKSNEIFSFAGLWETWKSPVGDVVRSFTIITTDANEIVAPIHNRMPVILKNEDEWLSDELFLRQHLAMLRPFPAEEMVALPVSKLLKNVGMDMPELLDERYVVPPQQMQQKIETLF